MSSNPAASRGQHQRRERRLLRVGIVHGRRIVEERLLAYGGDVTIGTSPRSTFIVPWDHVPERWRLFEERRGRRFLRLAGDMTARIADGASVTSVEARGTGTPAPAIPLSDRARGKVTVGETTVLFQLLRPPPPQPRPQLPLSVRRRIVTEIDRLFAVVLAFTLLLHAVVVVYLRQVEWPRHPSLEEIPDRFVHQIAHVPRPAPRTATAAADEPAGERAPTRHAPTPAGAHPARAPGKPREAPSIDVRSLGLIPLLTARAREGGSAITDVLSAGAVDRPLEEALRDVGGVGIASTETLRGLRDAGIGQPRVAKPEDLRATARIEDARAVGPVSERDVASRVKVDRPALEGGHADLESITREIRARRKAIAACYERALKLKPTLAGKLVVRFVITAAGTISAVDIDDDSLGAPEVGDCLRALVSHWRFAPPAEAPVELSFPFVFQAGG